MNNVSNTDLVLDFLRSWGPTKQNMFAAFDTFMTEETVWENVGLARTVGIEQAKAFVDAFPGAIDHIDVETLHIAAAGDVVLTERIDILYNEAGESVATLRVAGAFEVRNGRIVEWRDYFDTASLRGE
ncbi:MAG: snoaL-like domain protein [Alphaproteobacteria bacterium]|nr:snoaL-like domain protein [Alphaproteobacteria bacterium]